MQETSVIPVWLAAVLAAIAFLLGRWTARRRSTTGGGPKFPTPARSRVVHVPRMPGEAAPASSAGARLSCDGEARRLLGEGRLIDAIKLVRSETGLGLKEAKDLCEAMRDGRA